MKMNNPTNVHSINSKRLKKQVSSNIEEARLDQACLWISRIDRELVENEKQALSRWLSDTPENVKVFLEVAHLWDKMDTLNRLADLFPKNSSVYRGVGISKKWAGALVASVAMVISLSVLVITDNHSYFSSTQKIAVVNMDTVLRTNVGQSKTVNLPDGSEIVLNTNTLAEVQFTKLARIIELKQGEIHIDVAHDKSRPLSIIVAGKIIQAVGTAFNVEVKNDSVELIVTDGKVLVADILKNENTFEELEAIVRKLPSTSVAISKGEKINLTPVGQFSNFNFEEIVIKVEPVDIAASLSWRTGNLIFRGESLAEAMAEIGRYNDMTFTLEDSDDLRKIRVAGMFKTGDITGLLNVLEQNFNINHQQTSHNTILLKLAAQ